MDGRIEIVRRVGSFLRVYFSVLYQDFFEHSGYGVHKIRGRTASVARGMDGVHMELYPLRRNCPLLEGV